MAKIRNTFMTAAAMLIAPWMALATPVASGPTSEKGMASFAEYLGGGPTNIASGGDPGSACC